MGRDELLNTMEENMPVGLVKGEGLQNFDSACLNLHSMNAWKEGV